MGTEFLMIVIMWCSPQHGRTTYGTLEQCRREKIACIRKLKNFTNDDVIDKCLLGAEK